MKFFASFILLLAVANAINQSKDGDLKCDGAPVVTEAVASEWTDTNIFDVEVCVTTEHTPTACSDEKASSSLQLDIKVDGETKAVSVLKEFKLSDLTKDNKFCHVFKPCVYLKDLKGKKLSNPKLTASATFKATPAASEEAKKEFSVTMKATGYKDVKEAKDIKVEKDVAPLTVICNNFDCSVVGDEATAPTSNQTFKYVKDKAPECLEEATTLSFFGDAADDKKLYLHTFECAAGKCPKTLKVTKKQVPSDKPNSSTVPEPTAGSAFPVAGISSIIIAAISTLVA